MNQELKSLFEKIDKPISVILNFKDFKNLDEEISKIVKVLVNEKKFKGIYISIRNPSNYIIEKFKKYGINISNLLFIDAISQYVYTSTPGISIPAEIKIEETENVIMLKSPLNLTELGIVFLEISASLKKYEKVFIIFDSLDTILIYYEKEKFLKFFHFLVSKLKLFRIIGIFVQTSEKSFFVDEIKHLVDEIYNVSLK